MVSVVHPSCFTNDKANSVKKGSKPPLTMSAQFSSLMYLSALTGHPRDVGILRPISPKRPFSVDQNFLC